MRRSHADKGLEYLLEVVAQFGDDFVLNIVGDIDHDLSYYKKLTEIIGKHNIMGKIFFHVQVDDRSKLKRFYERSDVFVLPSIVEGIGVVILEAMSAGRPIVATNVGDIPEFVKDEYNGILMPPRDASFLANATNSLICSPSMRKQYGTNGFKYCQNVRDLHSWDGICRGMHDIPNRLVDAA